MINGVNKYLYWTPRLLATAFILFLFTFSFDVFEPSLPISEMIIGFLMHNIPVIILSIILYISWKYEIVGAIAFTLAGFLYILLLTLRGEFEWFMLLWPVIISGPAFFIAFLFYKNWKIRTGLRKQLTGISSNTSEL